MGASYRWAKGSVHIVRLPAAASDEHYDLHLAAVEHELASPIIIESRKDILSQKHWAERVEPFEHQIRNLITFCRRAPVALIADDVGLGKTVSAGLILNELQTRRCGWPPPGLTCCRRLAGLSRAGRGGYPSSAAIVACVKGWAVARFARGPLSAARASSVTAKPAWR